MKKRRAHRTHGDGGEARSRRGSLTWFALWVLALAALSAAPWALRGRISVQAAPDAPRDELRQRTAELIGHASSIRLPREQEKVKADALSAITAPCRNRNSLAVGCCPCNLGKSLNGLANRMIAQDAADAAKVRQAVLDWIAGTNPGGYSGAACDRKRCERPFREDGCGGMSGARLVF